MSITVKLKRGPTLNFEQYPGEPYEVAYNTELKRILIWDPEWNEWIDTCLSNDQLMYHKGHLIYNTEGENNG